MNEHIINKGTYLFKEGEQIKGLFLIKTGDFEISQKYRRQLEEKYDNQTFPIQIRRDIK